MQKCIIGMAADVAIKITSPPGKKSGGTGCSSAFVKPARRAAGCLSARSRERQRTSSSGTDGQ